MEIILAGIERPLVEAWQRFCGELEGVSVHHGSILEVECDAVVSPANSYGFMDGGVDMAYSQHFGWHVQEQLQQLIRQRHHGELLVGSAEIVPTQNERIPYLIAAPTMRVPMILADGVNPYLACRAALLLVKHGLFPTGARQGQPIAEVVRRIAFPGLGTGVGRVGFNTCAQQVRAAIEAVVFERLPFPSSWYDAQEQHQRLYTDNVRDLQY